jgi:Zn-dependent peptidase ImmA (M78 family)
MVLRRGFKSEAHALANEVRAELGLSVFDPLNPWHLAAHLEILVVALSSFRHDAPQAVEHFLFVEPDCFSAVTVFSGQKRMIVYNDAHARCRQVSDVTHELAHGLLLHPPHPALDTRGCRHWNEIIEQEAEFLSGALLITERAAMHIVLNNIPLDHAAHRYGVSVSLLRYRLNMVGAFHRKQYIENRRNALG